jgi:hypothetical protein
LAHVNAPHVTFVVARHLILRRVVIAAGHAESQLTSVMVSIFSKPGGPCHK